MSITIVYLIIFVIHKTLIITTTLAHSNTLSNQNKILQEVMTNHLIYLLRHF